MSHPVNVWIVRLLSLMLLVFVPLVPYSRVRVLMLLVWLVVSSIVPIVLLCPLVPSAILPSSVPIPPAACAPVTPPCSMGHATSAT